MKKFSFFILILLAISIEADAQGWEKQKFRNTKGDLMVLKYSWSGGWGLYNSTRNFWTIPAQYKYFTEFLISNNYGYADVRDSNNAVGVYDSNGILVIPFNKYKGITVLPGNLFVVTTKDNKDGVIDVSGRVVCPFGKYDDVWTQGSQNKGLRNVLLVAKKSGKCGLINVNGNPVTDFIFDWVDFPSNPDLANTLAIFTYKDNEYYVNYNWDVIKVVNKYTGKSPVAYNQYSNNSRNNSSNSSVKGAAVLGVFVGLAAIMVDYFSSHPSSSSSYSSSSSSRSSYSSSSSSRTTSLCSYCSGRGMENCVWCHGTGINKGGWFESDKVCFGCKGKGQYWCYHCGGRGSR